MEELKINLRQQWRALKAASAGNFKSLFLEVDTRRGVVKLFRRRQVAGMVIKTCSRINNIRLHHWEALPDDFQEEVLLNWALRFRTDGYPRGHSCNLVDLSPGSQVRINIKILIINFFFNLKFQVLVA